MLPTMPRWASRSMKISATRPSSRRATRVSRGLLLTIRSLVIRDRGGAARPLASRASGRSRSVSEAPHADAEDEADAHERRDDRRASVAHERKREPLDGHEPRDHSDIVYDLEREGRAHARDQERAEPVAREARGLEHAPQQEQVERERH